MSQQTNVRLAKPVVETLRTLPADQAAAVARAVRRIGITEGVPLPGNEGKHYMVMVPDDDHAPVVIYRQLPPIEGGGYLVTALSDRATFNAYDGSEQSAFLDTPAGRALLALAGIAAAVIGLRAASRSGGRV